MKRIKQLLKRAAGALLALLLLVSLVPGEVWAWEEDSEDIVWNGETVQVYVYTCEACGHGVKIWPDDEGNISSSFELATIEEYFCDECGLCWDCAREHSHCHACGDCIWGGTEGEDYCKECKKCRSCWSDDEHCPNCHKHREERCDQCSWNMCLECHDEHNAWCDYCGECLYAHYDNGTMCQDGEHHCQKCCIVCEDCDKCFAIGQKEADEGEYCNNCGLCIECGIEDEQHCPKCRICFQDNDRCEGSDLCLECCTGEGNHCPDCHKHVGDDGDWCPTGAHVHCYECAEPYLCPDCGECTFCMDVERCDDCGRCPDCCLAASESAGCDCGLCEESADFLDPEHRCAGCEMAFSCVEEFCEECGLCLDCCLAASEDEGCVCGICVASSEFEEHRCECGEFTCVRGEFCDDCGLCETCCLENSYDAGCDCGICVENDEFADPDHLCEGCEAAFSCVAPFCSDCGLCLDCCVSKSEDMGCTHEICVQSSAWAEHYCDVCSICKEDCDCGQDCCKLSYGDCGCGCGDCTGLFSCHCCESCTCSYDRSFTSVLGGIMNQPRNVGAYVSDGSNDDYLHTNKISFSVYAFGDQNELYYQWYRKAGADGTPEKLTDEKAGDEEYWGRNDAITSGATSQTLTTYVPADACVKDYCYFCEITDRDGNVLSTSREARLSARHLYKWASVGDGGHSYRCVGCGEYGKFGTEVRTHEYTERQILVYPTETEPGQIGNRCRICGEGGNVEVIAPLGKHERHEFHYYYTSREHWCECVCGKKINARSEHSWGEWILDKAATEKAKGEKHRVCLVCGCVQEAKIEKKLHAHGSYFTGDEYDHSFHEMNTRQHGRICDDPECGQWYDIEPHTFDEWEILAYPDWYNEGSMQRVCTGCQYTQTKKLPKWGENKKRLIVVEHGKSTRTVSQCRWDDMPVLTAEERPGYNFVGWNCDLYYHVERDDYMHYQNVTLMTKQYADYTGRTDVILVDDPNAQVMTVQDVPLQLKTLTGEELKNEQECYLKFYPVYEHIPVRVLIWPENSSRYGDRVMLMPGEGYDYTTGTVREGKTGTHLYLEEIETGEDGVDYPYEYVLHMSGYEGGPIKILSPDLDYQVNAKLAISIEDYESVIRSKAGIVCGIEVNSFNGGEVTMYSENGGKLTIDVEGGTNLVSVRGIDVVDNIGRTSLFLNHANIDIVSRNLHKPLGLMERSAVGICAGDVRIVGGTVSIEAHAPYLNNELAAVGIRAEGTIDIDSPALTIDVTDVDVGAGGTGIGLDAKSVLISMLTAKIVSDWYDDEGAELLDEDADMDAYAAGIFIDYPQNGIAMKLPKEDPAGIAAITTYGTTDEGDLTFEHCLGYTVKVNYDPDKLTLSPVGKVYVDSEGRFCVPAGGSLEFVAAAEAGYRCTNTALYRNGEAYVFPEIDENENRRYRIENVTECMELDLGGVAPIAPFASDPLPSTQTVLGGGLGTAAVTWEMNLYEVSKLNRKNTGSQEANGVLARHNENTVLDTDTAYSSGVWLQSYNDATGRWTNRPELGTFRARPHAFAEFTETRQYSRPGTTTQYRLAILFDGIQYYSEPFEVTWTADGAEVSARTASAVELYVIGGMNSNGTRVVYDDNGDWMRLDARCPDIYFDTYGGTYTNEFNRTHKVPEGDQYVRFAHFDAGKGILTLDGDPERWPSSLCEIRTASDSRGDLTVYAAADCGIYQNTATVGWIDRWGDGSTMIHDADSAAILNETGSVILTGAEEVEFYISAIGPYDMVREERADGSWFYTGERISAVRASGSIRASGLGNIHVYADCQTDGNDTPGYAGCAAALDAEGDILVGGETYLEIYSGYMGSGAGAAQAMYAAGDIRMEDDCHVYILTNGVRSNSLYCDNRASIWSEKTVTVDERARLKVESFGEEWCSIYAGDAVYLCSDRKTELFATPWSDDIDSSAVIAPRTVVTGFHSFTWKDPNDLSPTYGEWVFGDEHTYVTYLSDEWDGSRTLTVMDGKPRRLTLVTQGLSADRTQIEITRNGDTASVLGSEFEICPGDTVTLYPPEGLPGSTFDNWGWADYGPQDVKALDDGAITFTMPDWNITPVAHFETSVISNFEFTLDGSDPAMTSDHRIGKGDLSFHVEIPVTLDPGTQLSADVKLECTYENEDGELLWADEEHFVSNTYSYVFTDDADYDYPLSIATFDVSKTLCLADIVPQEDTPMDWGRILESPDRSYRLRITLSSYEKVGDRYNFTELCSLVTNPFELSWNKPFTVDVDEDGRNPEIYIPSGDVGTAFAIDFSKYVSGGSGMYHYSILPAPEPIPMEFTFNEDRGTFCFYHTENSVGMNYSGNYVQVTDVITGDIALIVFDVQPTVNTQMYDTYVGGVHVSEYNRDDVLGDGSVSYAPAENGNPAVLTLKGATLTSGYCDRRDPAVYGDNAFAAIFTREDLEIVCEGKSRIVLDENCEAAGDPYVQDALITGIYGYGANVTLSGSGELIVRSSHGFCLAENGTKLGGNLTLNGCSLELEVTEGNVLGKAGSKGFTYVDGRLSALSAQSSTTTLLNGITFAEGAQENIALLLSAEADRTKAQPGSPDMLTAQKPGAILHYILIRNANRNGDPPTVSGIVSGETGEINVFVDKSVPGVNTMQAIVAVYEKDSGRLLDFWMGEIDISEVLTGTGLTYNEANRYQIMVLDGDGWRPLSDSAIL